MGVGDCRAVEAGESVKTGLNQGSAAFFSHNLSRNVGEKFGMFGGTHER